MAYVLWRTVIVVAQMSFSLSKRYSVVLSVSVCGGRTGVFFSFAEQN